MDIIAVDWGKERSKRSACRADSAIGFPFDRLPGGNPIFTTSDIPGSVGSGTIFNQYSTVVLLWQVAHQLQKLHPDYS